MPDVATTTAGWTADALMALILSAAMFIGGALVLLVAQLELREARRSQSWAVTMGWVTHSEVRRLATDTGYVFQADIAYVYTVDARRYVGRRVRFAETGYGPGAQRERVLLTVQRYPVGQPLPVYYDPRRPEASVLERRLAPGLRPAVVMGAAMLLAGVISSLSWGTALAAPLIH